MKPSWCTFGLTQPFPHDSVVGRVVGAGVVGPEVVGISVGIGDGIGFGINVGCGLGTAVGAGTGTAVGEGTGTDVGAGTGTAVGLGVGRGGLGAAAARVAE